MGQRQLLTETKTIRLAILESSDGGKMRAKGEFARADVPTANGRVYPKAIWETNIRKLKEDIKNRKVYGELDHPADGKTKLQRVCVLLTSLELDPDGAVIGEIELLDTEKGKDLQAIVRGGGAVGVSSRGYGSITQKDGFDVVQEDFNLMTFDVVADPAMSTAYPDFTTEQSAKQGNMIENSDKPKKEILKMSEKEDEKTGEPKEVNKDAEKETEAEKKESEGENDPEDKEEKKKEEAEEEKPKDKEDKKEKEEEDKDGEDEKEKMKAEMEARIAVEVEEATERVRAEVIASLINDPKYAGSKAALESVKKILRPYVLEGDAAKVISDMEAKVEATEKKMGDLKRVVENQNRQIKDLELISKDLGFSLKCYQDISMHPRFEGIMDSLDFNRIDTMEDLDRAIAVFKEDLECFKKQAEAEEEDGKEKEKEEESEMSKLKKENEELKAKLKDSDEKSVKAESKAYFESKVANHPAAAKMRQMFESLAPKTNKQIDVLVEQNSWSSKTFNDVRKNLAGRKLPDNLVEEALRNTMPEAIQESVDTSEDGDVSMAVDQFKKLAGL